MRFPILNKSRDEIQTIQLRKIQYIVSHAYEKSDFYHQYYKNNGFHPSMIKRYEDIQLIPIVKRIMLKNAPVENIITQKNFSKLHLHTTSGSSGIPVRFYYTSKEEYLKNYGVMRAYMIMGMKLKDCTVALRDPIDIRQPGLYEKIGIMAYDYYNIYDSTNDIYHRLCKKYEKIDILKGMPSDLMNLCYEIRKGSQKFPPVRLLISDSEVLDDFSRKYITDTIGTSVLDYYASVENGCIAFQMKGSNKYFLNEDQVLVECELKENLIGDAIVTNLRNTTFPIIRYQIGDVIEFGDGQSDLHNINLKTIERIQGKYLDFIVLPDNSIVSPHVPKQEMTHLAGIKRFQIVQKDFDKVVVKIEKDIDFQEDMEEKIINVLNAAFKNQITCTIEYDGTLSKKKANKFKCIQSDVAQKFLSDNL